MSKRWTRSAARMRKDQTQQMAEHPLTARNIRRLVAKLRPETAEAYKREIDAAISKAQGRT